MLSDDVHKSVQNVLAIVILVEYKVI